MVTLQDRLNKIINPAKEDGNLAKLDPLYRMDVKPDNKAYEAWEVNAASHGMTTRITYTVPANTRALFEHVYTAVGPVETSYAVIQVRINPVGGGGYTAVECYCKSTTDKVVIVAPMNIILEAGDVVLARSSSGSSGSIGMFVDLFFREVTV